MPEISVDEELSERVMRSAPNTLEFTQTLGQVTWLMSLSKAHRNKDVAWIEANVTAPLMFRQVRVFLREKQPIAAITWAYSSSEVASKIENKDEEESALSLTDWRSGQQIKIVECISPFYDKKIFIEKFLSDVRNAQAGA